MWEGVVVGEEPFQVVIDTLGHWSVSMVPGAERIRIYSSEADRTAHMEICLAHDSWSAREEAIEVMAEIRQQFLDDVSINYSFGASFDSAASERRTDDAHVFAR